MASPSRQAPAGVPALLGGGRARSYGSLVRAACSPVRERRLEHPLAPGDTLAGLALRYGVTMEQIKRANRLYTNDSIFLKKTLYIPIQTEPRDIFRGLDSDDEKDGEEGQSSKDDVWPHSAERTKTEQGLGSAGGAATGQEPGPDLSASDFLKKLDSQIRLSKQAAAQKLQGGDIRTLTADAGHSQQPPSSPRMQQHAVLGPVPLTRTSRTRTLRDQEDEIFKL